MNGWWHLRAVVVALAVGCITLTAAAPAATSATRARSGAGTTAEDRVVRLVADGAWSWYMDPRALTVGRHTYVGSVTRTGDVQVVKVSHANASLSHAVLHHDLDADDHAAPSLVGLPDGRVAAFYSGHNSSDVRYRVAVRTRSVQFGQERRLAGSGLEGRNATYTQPFYLRAYERYYLFTRVARELWLTTSRDLRTWSRAVKVVRNATGRDDQWPYYKFASDGDRKIHIGITEGLSLQDNSLYHVVLAGGAFYRSDGRRIRTMADVRGGDGQPPRPLQATDGTLVYDGRGSDGMVRLYDLALDSTQRPTVAVTTRPTSSSYTYQWLRWTGTSWSRSRMLAAGTRAVPSEAKGIVLQPGTPTTIYLVQQRDGQYELDRWTTPDLGETWTATPITTGSATGNRTPVVPWGPATSRVRVLWMNGRYDAYDQYWTGLRMLTDGAAPTTTAMSLGADWSGRSAVTAVVRVRAGIGGPGAAQAEVTIRVRAPGATEERVVSSGRTGPRGWASLPVPAVREGTRVRAVTSMAAGWGWSASPSRTAG